MRTFHQKRIEQLPSSFIDTINSVMGIVMNLDDVSKVIMFGSCSRGTQTDISDIDLLLLLNNTDQGISYDKLEEKVGTSIYEQFDTNYQKPVDLLFADEDTYTNSTRIDSVYHHIKKDGVTLYE